MISRRLAGLPINFKKATGHACRSYKDTCTRFYCFQWPPGCNLGQHKIKCILSLSGQCTDVTINDQSDTQSCQTLQLIIAGVFFISLNKILADI